MMTRAVLVVILSVFVSIQAELVSNKRANLDLGTALQCPLVRNLLKVPTLVLVGPRFAGKSLLISLLAGYDITYSDPLLGTLCPVRYVFRNVTDERGIGKFVVNGEVVERNQIADKVEAHMKQLQLTIGFTQDEMIVQINEPDSHDVNVIDMPGIPPSFQSHYNLVQQLIQEAVQYPHVVLVGMMNAGGPDPVSALCKML